MTESVLELNGKIKLSCEARQSFLFPKFGFLCGRLGRPFTKPGEELLEDLSE
jgi:hypothetical protein